MRFIILFIIVASVNSSCGDFQFSEGNFLTYKIPVEDIVVSEEASAETKSVIPTEPDSYFPLDKGRAWKYRNTFIDYPYYRNELVDITASMIDNNVKEISFEGVENITGEPLLFEGKLTEYYNNEDGILKLYKSLSKINYYGEESQEIIYEINYAPGIIFLETDTEPKVGDKYSTDTRVTIYKKEDGACFITYDFPGKMEVKITDKRPMVVENQEVEALELTIKDSYNWFNIELFCSINRDGKSVCPSKNFQPQFLTRKIYIAKGIGVVRFTGEENIMGYGDWVGKASPEPIIDLVE